MTGWLNDLADTMTWRTWRDLTLGVYIFHISASAWMTRVGLAAEPDPSQPSDGSMINQLLTLGALAVAAAIVWRRRVPLGHLLRGVGPLAVPLALALLSVAWSAFPDLALRRVLRLVIEVAILVLLTSTYREPGRLIQVAARALAVVACLDVALIAVPSVSFTEIGYAGIHLEKNQAGSFALIALAFFSVRLWERWGGWRAAVWAALICMDLIVLKLTSSKTSIALCGVSLLAAGGLMIFGRLNGPGKLAAGSFALACALGAALVLVAANVTWARIFVAVTGDATLTGRDKVWEFMTVQIAEAPVLGYGYGSFWHVGDLIPYFLLKFGVTFPFSSAHNGYLDLLAQLGAVGMVAVLVLTAGAARDIYRLGGEEGAAQLKFICIYMFTAFYIHNITESTLMRVGMDMWIFFVLAAQAAAKFGPGVRPQREPPWAESF
jgi:O-antigen ligase